MSTPSHTFDESCAFCNMVSCGRRFFRVFEDEADDCIPGPSTVVSRTLPADPEEPFGDYQTICPILFSRNCFANVRFALSGSRNSVCAPPEGTFIAANNRVSQSVPHFHVHIVPRTKRRRLEGAFFWPRRKYKNAEEIGAVLSAFACRDLRKCKAGRRD